MGTGTEWYPVFSQPQTRSGGSYLSYWGAFSVQSCRECGGSGQHDRPGATLRGASFDVHAAREWAEAELRACDGADEDRVVLEDWTRNPWSPKGTKAKHRGGLGPEASKTWAARVDEHGREYELCDCSSWDGAPDIAWTGDYSVGVRDHHKSCKRMRHHGGWPGRLMRDPACPVPSWTPNAARRRRVAQRLLDTLDGRCPWNPSAKRKPSECRGCAGDGYRHSREIALPSGGVAGVDVRTCPDCNGTGHNLRGYLPKVEWPAVVRRKVADVRYGRDVDPAYIDWCGQLESALEAGPEWDVFTHSGADGQGNWTTDTRVTPRERRSTWPAFVQRQLDVVTAPGDEEPLP